MEDVGDIQEETPRNDDAKLEPKRVVESTAKPNQEPALTKVPFPSQLEDKQKWDEAELGSNEEGESEREEEEEEEAAKQDSQEENDNYDTESHMKEALHLRALNERGRKHPL
ncbi:bromodomain-containing protein 2-like [Gossypium hirsutum]|uniref:Bromodomain-containing protein 2-like n=1 Tax=Gossypium hirsutum TaxID=3635 RepID=A0A1U8I4P4_GOSHI|nr:bromodomain-containing protein 2-like [Gossypium hirsutum]